MKLRYMFLAVGMSAIVFAGGPAKKKPVATPTEQKPVPAPKPPVKTDAGQEWEVTKDGGLFAYTVDFHITKDEKDIGEVQRKGLFTPRYSYTLFDENGEKVAYALTRFLSPGIIFHNMTDIDVWDAENKYIGGIFGKFWTNSRAKFDFYLGNKQHIGSAHLNSETTDFVIASNHGKKGMRPTGTMHSEGYGDMSAMEVKLKNTFQDERLLKIFTAFVSDYHDYFIVKPEVNAIFIDNSSNQ